MRLFTEQELIKGLAANDVRCYEELFKRWFDRIHAFALGMLKDETSAEDIAQNVFLKLWLNRNQIHAGQTSLKSYLFVMTRNEVLNSLRSQHISALPFGEVAEALAVPDTNFDTDAVVTREELRSALQRAVDALPEKRREVFVMSRFKHLSNKEIALRLDLSVRTVEKHLELAVRDIRREVSPFLFILMLVLNLC